MEMSLLPLKSRSLLRRRFSPAWAEATVARPIWREAHKCLRAGQPEAVEVTSP